jgi:2,3-bisphosphoglycerate-independent phosphoglycerate mutase
MGKKYILLVGDGMGDYPLDELQGRTPLEAAHTPHLDRLVPRGRMGTARTIPESMEPGSDIANMSLLGYDPQKFHTGRAPLEAASMGIHLAPEEVAFRCNLVTLGRDQHGVTRMEDYSSEHITSKESHRLIETLQDAVAGTPLKLYAGISYRHLLVWPSGLESLATTPPHDISGEPTAKYQLCYGDVPVLAQFMEKCAAMLADHPVNRDRVKAGKRPANAVWLWGQGKAPSMPTLKERFGLTGAMISAVDLLKGLGVYAGLVPIAVPGATGYLDTNYEGKVDAALTALQSMDLVYIHIEAPDETAHEGNLAKKIEAIEAFDARVLGPVVAGARQFDEANLLVVTDHLTPVKVRTHVGDPVPFLIVENRHGAMVNDVAPGKFCERTALAADWFVGSGVELFQLFVGMVELP